MSQTVRDANARMIEYLARDAQRYDEAIALQRSVFMGERPFHQPLLISSRLPEEFASLPRFTYKEIHYDSEKMLYNGLLDAITSQMGGRESLPSVRANMGVGIVPALFGLKQALFDDKMPWLLEHLPADTIRDMTKNDLTITDEFRWALDHMEYIADALKGSGVRVYPLDIQGAFDTAHLVMGDDIFYQMFDDEELVHHLLDLSCDAIDMAFRECLKRIPGSDQTVAHYSYLAMPRELGGLKLSEDTSTLLSPIAIDEFVKPYMHRALENADGGYIHFCGRNGALLDMVLSDPLVRGLNLGNPDKHDMADVLHKCAEHGKVFIGGMPRLEGESTADFIKRVTDASTLNGRGYLLLVEHVDTGEMSEFTKAWDNAFAAT